MNKETIELIKQYILFTANDYNGISREAYELIGHIMQNDRTLAVELCDLYESIIPMGSRYQVQPENDEPYEE